jgi:GntR family carbon starvation induced transcriptional regulator
MEEPRTRAQWAEWRLREAIIAGELQPGARVRVEDLAVEWEVSSTPLREALRTLAGDGLIVLSPQRGARVATMSTGEMFGIWELRLLLETHALWLSLQNGDERWSGELDRVWRELDRAQRSKPKTPFGLEPAHTDFHRTLISGCGSATLLRATDQLAAQAMRFRTLAAPRRPGGPRQSRAEHRRLYRLAKARAVEEAVPVLAAHIGWPVLACIGVEAFEGMLERIAAMREQSELVLAGLRGVGELEPVGG